MLPEEQKSSWMTHNVVPIVIALITAFGGSFGSYKLLDYRLTQLEKSNVSSDDIKILDNKIEIYIKSQDEINKLLLSFLANKGYVASKNMASKNIESNLVKNNIVEQGPDVVYGSQAYQLLLKQNHRKNKQEIIEAKK